MRALGHPATPAVFGRVVIVASLGGLPVITTVLGGLPASYPIPIALVQHRSRVPNGRDVLIAILTRRTCLPVQAAEAGMMADELGITIVPAQCTATIDESGRWILADTGDDAQPGNALLVSSAKATPTVAIILTGALADGADGCRAVKRWSGRVLAQDPATARAASMPANAIATGCADFVLAPERIATALLALTTAPGAAELLAVPLPPWARLSS